MFLKEIIQTHFVDALCLSRCFSNITIIISIGCIFDYFYHIIKSLF